MDIHLFNQEDITVAIVCDYLFRSFEAHYTLSNHDKINSVLYVTLYVTSIVKQHVKDFFSLSMTQPGKSNPHPPTAKRTF